MAMWLPILAASFVAPPVRPPALRAPPVVASAKVVPFAYTGVGAALAGRAFSAATRADATVLATTSALAIFNLAVTDGARLASAKRAVANYVGRDSLPSLAVKQFATAKRWYMLTRLHLAGQLVALVWMTRAGVLGGAAGFMLANVLFFAGGAGAAKHDMDGRPAPIKPSLLRFVFAVDSVLFGAAALAAASPVGSLVRAVGSYIFCVGCLIGAVEGFPQWLKAIAPFFEKTIDVIVD